VNSAITLVGLRLIVGFAFGRFSWRAIALSSVALAGLAAAMLHSQGYGPLSGVVIIAVCLTISQVAYLAGMWFVDRRSGALIQKDASRDPGQDRNEHVRRKDQQKQKTPSATIS
jgi:hypothetical protein